MNRGSKHAVSVLLLSVIAIAMLGSGLQVEASTITEWTIPTGASYPWGIAVSGGFVYFTDSVSGGQIGRLDPSNGVFTKWTIPTAGSAPWDIAVYGGLVYFVEYEYIGNKVGRLDPSNGLFTEWTIPTLDSGPRGIAVSGSGLVYFTEEFGNKVGRLDPSNGVFTEWTIPTAGSVPKCIAVYGGLVYFTENSGMKIGRLDPSNGVFTEWTIPTESSSPRGIAVSGGFVYFTEGFGNKVGRLDPSNGLFTEWTIPTAGSVPWGIAVYGGFVYFTEYSGNKVGRLDPSNGVFTEWTIPTGSSQPEDIAVSAGRVYFTEHDGNRIGRLAVSPVSTVTTSVSKTISTTSTTSGVSTASSTYLSVTTVTSSTVSTTSVTASTTSVATSISDALTVELPPPWAAVPTGTTDAAPAIAYFNERLYAAVKGRGSNGIYLNTMDPVTLVWKAWTLQPGATPNSPALAASASYLFMVVRGMDNRIYWRRMTTGGSWSNWAGIPTGSIDAAPAIAFFNERLYAAVKGRGSNEIWLNSMNEAATPTWGSWVKLGGATPRSPALAASGSYLYLLVRGMDDKIYWQRMTTAGSWSGSWTAVPAGSTDAAPAATFFDCLYVAVKGRAATSIWLNSMNEFGTPAWSGWTQQSGSTSNSPALAASWTHVYIAVKGSDNRIYTRRIN